MTLILQIKKSTEYINTRLTQGPSLCEPLIGHCLELINLVKTLI